MEMVFLLIGIGLFLVLAWLRTRMTGFVAQRTEHYVQGRAGQFDLRTHLNGPLVCEGVIYGPFGRVTTRFDAEFNAQWDGNTGVMHERFFYDDGSQQRREWHLSLGNDGRIKATAPDVVGIGRGEQSGDAVQLKYRLKLPDESGGHVVDVIDWMYLTPRGNIVNRSQFRKFGIKVAELVATMRPATLPGEPAE